MATLLGIAVHKLCASSEHISTPSEIRELTKLEFEKLVRSHPTAPKILDAVNAPLLPKNIIPQAEFIGKSGIVYKVTQSRSNTRSTRALTSQNKVRGVAASRQFGSEISLKSDRFDLIGRADWIEDLSDGHIRIVDYKTGARLIGDDFTLKRELLLQVGAYAVMAIEQFSVAGIILQIISPSSMWEQDFTEALKSEVALSLSNILATIPRDQPLRSNEIATPGISCRWCKSRHVCAPYKRYAEREWKAADGRLLPLDTWGVITEVKSQSGSLVEVRLRDDASRQVRIRNIPIEIIVGDDVGPGSRIRAFGLMASESGRGSTYPHNFYVADVDRPNYSAFAARLVTG
jgi:hypothetical protein